MIAEVIPLRRRTRDGAWTPREAEPSHSGVFDPPPDPEPPEEYSVWDRPTAELVRRQPRDRLVSVDARGHRWGSVLRARGAPIAAGLAALVAAAALIITTVGLRGDLRTAASTDVGSRETGLGAQLGGLPPSSQPAHARHSASGSRHSATRRTRARRSAAAHSTTQAGVALARAQPAAGSGTYVSQQVATRQPAAHAGGVAPTATTASHEFSFEQ
jgi:hypothetical protein